MRKYETAFIIDGLLNEADSEALITKFENSLEKHGAVFERIIRWGKRVLAYEIKKRIYGYYVIFYYEANPSIIRTFHH
ncbi:MAG TPA: 30S ribosomal protein S6, partial [Anaerolineae bacterium]|nr:30S ribosomal protein S6 [Anaerolineae bacterium]